jgi:hypothetical protein
MNKSVLPKLEKFPPAKQRRLDQLLEKNAEGTISPKEKSRLESLVAEADDLMVANSKLLAEFARSQSPPPPVNAVPVTVWINPQLADH